MNTDDTRFGTGPQDTGPGAEEDLFRTARLLRDTLETEAARVVPGDRFDSILTASHAVRAHPSSRRPWLAGVAAAAVVAAAAGIVWVASRPDATPPVPGDTRTSIPTGTTPPPTGSPTGTPSTGPSSEPTTGMTTMHTTSPSSPPGVVPPTGTSTGGPTVPPRTVGGALPVYQVATVTQGGQSSPRLTRLFRSNPGEMPATDRIRLALQDAVAATDPNPAVLALWSGVSVTGVVEAPQLITVTLSAGRPSLSSTEAEAAVQQLVWTAQAASGTTSLPSVRFVLADGSTTLAGPYSTTTDYTRVTGQAAQSALLAPIWVDSPAPGQTFTSGASVRIAGQASVFEGAVSWELLRGTAVVDDGAMTATAGAPARGTFEARTVPLFTGDYTLRVFSHSAKDGSVDTVWEVPFTVS